MAIPEMRLIGGLLFGGNVPKLERESTEYSFGWGGSASGDNSFSMIKFARDTNSVPEFFDKIDELTKDTGYTGLAANMILGDNKGNIGY